MLSAYLGPVAALYALYLIFTGKPFFGLKQYGGASRTIRDKRPWRPFIPTLWLRLAGASYLTAFLLFTITQNYDSIPIFTLEVLSGLLYAVGLFFAFSSPRVP